jgi:nucleoid-associated protein YgaU
MGLEKVTLTNTVSGQRVVAMFNPEDYTVNRENNWAQATIPGLSAPLLQFAGGAMQTLEMELLLDTRETHGSAAAGSDVRDQTNKVLALMDIDATTHAPPPVLFAWGSLTFTCVLARAAQRFIMFRPDGVPIRARLQVTFNEFKDIELEAKEIKRETADYTKRHTVGQEETLSGIAAATYGDPSMWRPIAIRNGIDDPRELAVGLQLAIPSLPYRDPDSGEVFA